MPNPGAARLGNKLFIKHAFEPVLLSKIMLSDDVNVNFVLYKLSERSKYDACAHLTVMKAYSFWVRLWSHGHGYRIGWGVCGDKELK